MRIFHNKEQYQGCNPYSMKKYVDRKRIIFNIIVILLTLITLLFVVYYVIDTTVRVKQSEQFVNQLMQIKQQELVAKQEKVKNINFTEEAKERVRNIYKSEDRRAFLTFDDGPSQNTGEILKILKENDIKAIFFMLGSQAERMPDMVKKVYEEGHYIANHGYSHIYSNIYKSPEEVLNEYNKCNQIVANAIGKSEFNSYLFRFPGGSVGGKYAKIKQQAIELLEQNNILYLDWNALTGDSEKTNPTEEYLMSNLQKTVSGKNSVVILMHDSAAKKITADFLPKVIEYLKNQGYEFEDFYNIMK